MVIKIIQEELQGSDQEDEKVTGITCRTISLRNQYEEIDLLRTIPRAHVANCASSAI